MNQKLNYLAYVGGTKGTLLKLKLNALKEHKNTPYSSHLKGTFSITNLYLVVPKVMLIAFLQFFGLPFIKRYQEKKVMVVYSSKETGVLKLQP